MRLLLRLLAQHSDEHALAEHRLRVHARLARAPATADAHVAALAIRRQVHKYRETKRQIQKDRETHNDKQTRSHGDREQIEGDRERKPERQRDSETKRQRDREEQRHEDKKTDMVRKNDTERRSPPSVEIMIRIQRGTEVEPKRCGDPRGWAWRCLRGTGLHRRKTCSHKGVDTKRRRQRNTETEMESKEENKTILTWHRLEP